MPVWIFDNQSDGVSTVYDGYDEMPRSLTEWLAARGDVEAQAWLDTHPVEADSGA